MKLIIALAFVFSFSTYFAQETLNSPVKQTEASTVQVDSLIQATKIDSSTRVHGLVEKKNGKIDLLIEDYLENKKYNGYRIQIFSSSNNRLDAVKAKSEFLRDFPNTKSYLVYQAPNYKVRVGDFLDRLEANKQLLLIQESFPNAFLIKGEVEPTMKR
ncbi:MAG: hypothetical protein ACJAV5_000331 [Vicingaceae bacterium]|jgi:hypothetical protein